jgi:hypothetical protein
MSKTNKDSLTQYEILEESLDIPARYVISSLFICMLLVFFGYLDLQITNVVGIVFPVYWTIKAIENPQNDDDKQWLTYWAIFTGLLLNDIFFGYYLEIIPYFYFFKLCFLMWLFLPNTKGALQIHDRLIKTYFGTFDMPRVKQFLTRTFRFAREFILDILDSVKEVTAKIIQIPEAVVETSESYIDQAAEAIGSKLVQNYSDQPIKDTSGKSMDDLQNRNEMDIPEQAQQQMSGNFDEIKRHTPIESDEPRRKELIEQ